MTLLPSFLALFVIVNPLTYAVNAVRDIMIKGFLPINTLATTSVILLAFTGAMIGLAFIFFKNTSKQI